MYGQGGLVELKILMYKVHGVTLGCCSTVKEGNWSWARESEEYQGAGKLGKERLDRWPLAGVATTHM
jgi:hypothetical protein